jgi:hypothetical protein
MIDIGKEFASPADLIALEMRVSMANHKNS